MNIEPWQEFLQLVQLHIMHGRSHEDACRVAWYQATENAKTSEHALIVQMQEALDAGLDAASIRLASAEEAYAGYPSRYKHQRADVDKISAALKAANQYLEHE